jgi:hypothetical protein
MRASSPKAPWLSNKYQTFSAEWRENLDNTGKSRFYCQLPKLNVAGSIPVSRSKSGFDFISGGVGFPGVKG